MAESKVKEPPTSFLLSEIFRRTLNLTAEESDTKAKWLLDQLKRPSSPSFNEFASQMALYREFGGEVPPIEMVENKLKISISCKVNGVVLATNSIDNASLIDMLSSLKKLRQKHDCLRDFLVNQKLKSWLDEKLDIGSFWYIREKFKNLSLEIYDSDENTVWLNESLVKRLFELMQFSRMLVKFDEILVLEKVDLVSHPFSLGFWGLFTPFRSYFKFLLQLDLFLQDQTVIEALAGRPHITNEPGTSE